MVGSLKLKETAAARTYFHGCAKEGRSTTFAMLKVKLSDGGRPTEHCSLLGAPNPDDIALRYTTRDLMAYYRTV